MARKASLAVRITNRLTKKSCGLVVFNYGVAQLVAGIRPITVVRAVLKLHKSLTRKKQGEIETGDYVDTNYLLRSLSDRELHSVIKLTGSGLRAKIRVLAYPFENFRIWNHGGLLYLANQGDGELVRRAARRVLQERSQK